MTCDERHVGEEIVCHDAEHHGNEESVCLEELEHLVVYTLLRMRRLSLFL